MKDQLQERQPANLHPPIHGAIGQEDMIFQLLEDQSEQEFSSPMHHHGTH